MEEKNRIEELEQKVESLEKQIQHMIGIDVNMNSIQQALQVKMHAYILLQCNLLYIHPLDVVDCI
jgi:hypothetical protein